MNLRNIRWVSGRNTILGIHRAAKLRTRHRARGLEAGGPGARRQASLKTGPWRFPVALFHKINLHFNILVVFEAPWMLFGAP